MSAVNLEGTDIFSIPCPLPSHTLAFSHGLQSPLTSLSRVIGRGGAETLPSGLSGGLTRGLEGTLAHLTKSLFQDQDGPAKKKQCR